MSAEARLYTSSRSYSEAVIYIHVVGHYQSTETLFLSLEAFIDSSKLLVQWIILKLLHTMKFQNVQKTNKDRAENKMNLGRMWSVWKNYWALKNTTSERTEEQLETEL